MSTIFIADKDAITAGEFAIVRPTNQEMTTQLQDSLRDYVLRTMKENNLSAVDVAKNSQRRGGGIARATVQMIIQSKTHNPGIITLRDLARGLMRPLDEVLAHALGQAPAEHPNFLKSDLANLWELAKDLPPAEQKLFKRFVQIMEREARRLLSGD